MNVTQVRQLIESMPQVDRAILKDKLADHKAVANFLGRGYNRELCQVVEALLDGKQITVRRITTLRSGKCKVVS